MHDTHKRDEDTLQTNSHIVCFLFYSILSVIAPLLQLIYLFPRFDTCLTTLGIHNTHIYNRLSSQHIYFTRKETFDTMMLYKLVVLGDGGVGKVSIGWEMMPRFMHMHIYAYTASSTVLCVCVCVCVCVRLCV